MLDQSCKDSKLIWDVETQNFVSLHPKLFMLYVKR